MKLARTASLRWRLPLLILLVLAIVQAAFLWIAYRQTTRALLAVGETQLEQAGRQLAGLLTQVASARLAEARRLANTPAIRRFAATGEGSAEAMQALRVLGAKDPQSTIVLDARAAGDAVRISEGNVTMRRAPQTSGGGALPAEGVAPLRAEGEHVFFKVTAAVPGAADEGGPSAAALSLERRLSSSSGADPIEELLGRNAVLRLGNASHDLWTDLARPAQGPPLAAGQSFLRYVHDGDPRIGVASDVTGTPWRTWVEFSERSLLEPANMLVRQMVPATIFLTILAVLAVAGVTRGVIGPLEDMASAADRLAHGDFQQRVAVRRRDEIGQLADAFNLMAARIATGRSELESRVKARTAELEALNQELEAFSYSVSHDLRAPLRSIDGFSQALVEDFSGPLPAEGLDYLHRIRNAAQHMGRLIDDLLKLARVTRTELSVTDVDLSAIAREIAARLAESEPERRVDWRIQPGLIVRGDAQLLQIALENLLSNAWKFTSRTPGAVIELTSADENGQPAYAVRDNGAGFDMAHAKKLFGAFQRLHSAREFPGTGVGLATVQRIVHKHGGSVWAEAAPGAGATFAFTLGK
jgi:signal transduction histidine kinase